MLWPALALASLAIVFFQLGAYSVWLSVVRILLFITLFAAGAWLLHAAWRRMLRRGEPDR